jgi:hypothetical protein
MKTKRGWTTILVVGLALLAGAASAQSAPQLINYQGRISDAAGRPLDGQYVTLTFTFYGTETGGAPLLSVLQQEVLVTGGLYNLLIGSGTVTPGSEINLTNVFRKHGEVWMGVKVDGGEEMTPRARIASVPYALACESARTIDLGLIDRYINEPDYDSDGYDKALFSGDDCDDSDPLVFPGAPEVCDGVDNQCPGDPGYGQVDEVCSGTCTDSDHDGRGPACSMGPDCDDFDLNNWNSCAGCADTDNDLFFAGCDDYVTIDGPDCNDYDAAINPGATEVCDDGIDSDCDGLADGDDPDCCVDLDGDGRGIYCTLGPDCDDLDPNNWTEAGCANCEDVDLDRSYVGCDRYYFVSGPDCDDNDPNNWRSCATCLDADHDLWYGPWCDQCLTILCWDCNDGDSLAHPGAPELCSNGLDNDCDGKLDGADTDCPEFCDGIDHNDRDGDKFCDTWEDQDYIDLNHNGHLDGDDFQFPHAIFSAVTHTGAGVGVLGPAPTDTASAVASAAIEVTIAAGGSTGVATFTYAINGGSAIGPLATGPGIDLPGNVRLYFSNGYPEPSFVSGDTYGFQAGVNAKVADKDVPNIYIQYDYMGWAAPGATCNTTQDCIDAGKINEVCHEGHCSHNHEPYNPTFQDVVEAFARQNVRLYIDPVHHEIPHSQVITWQTAGDPYAASCAGAVPGALGSYAVNFHAVKNRASYGGPFDPRRREVFHYAVFGHYTTCDSYDHCQACPLDRAAPPGNAMFGSSGLAELPGNDFMVTLGDLYFGAYAMDRELLPAAEAGTFMHELGHNLGLHHNGDLGLPAYSPNYMSIMSYNYSFNGIWTSTVVGSSLPDGPARLDYSNTDTLETLNEGSLDEFKGLSPLASGNKDICWFQDGLNSNFTFGAGAGPIDWTGDGLIQSNVQADLNAMNCACEQFRPYNDWMHQTCVTTSDCPFNNVRRAVNGGRFTHEPCLNGRCQSLIYDFQNMPWGIADGPPPPEHVGLDEPTPAKARATHTLLPPRLVKMAAQPEAAAPPGAAAPSLKTMGNTGVVEATILGSANLDVTQVVVSSLRVGPAAAAWATVGDVNHDGYPDLSAGFLMADPSVGGATTVHGWLENSQVILGKVEVAPGKGP